MARNNEIIRLAKKAADAWRNTHEYQQAAQIIDMLVEELEKSILAPPAEDNNVSTKVSNEPLTLDELQEMDGQPVWVEELNRWALVDLMYSRGDELIMALFDDGDIKVRNAKLCNLHCYRRPPEGEK